MMIHHRCKTNYRFARSGILTVNTDVTATDTRWQITDIPKSARAIELRWIYNSYIIKSDKITTRLLKAQMRVEAFIYSVGAVNITDPLRRPKSFCSNIDVSCTIKHSICKLLLPVQHKKISAFCIRRARMVRGYDEMATEYWWNSAAGTLNTSSTSQTY